MAPAAPHQRQGVQAPSAEPGEEEETAGMGTPNISLEDDLAWLGITGCTCPYEWKGLGVLYGISMGEGWVRMLTVKTCPEHGEDSEQALRERRRHGRCRHAPDYRVEGLLPASVPRLR